MLKENLKNSFTAASVFPTKLLHKKVIEDGKIIPMHAQIIPTNHCNLKCKFCSYADREKNLEIDFNELKKSIDVLASRGTKALTWTGGGETCLYNNINEALNYAGSKGIQSGMVTNGTLLDKLTHHNNLTWCRISSSDDRVPAYDKIIKAIANNPQTDWAFSHVVTEKPDVRKIADLVSFSNEYDFTHIRLVSDLLNLDNVLSMDTLRWWLERVFKYHKGKELDFSKVIYQGRKDSIKGTKDCYISLLKPVIGPEGIFPCCGTNYAIEGIERKPVDEMKMGEIKDLAYILDNQKHFDGKICDTCYYSEYNSSLKKLLNKPEHLNFV